MLDENENILLESTVDEYGEGKRQLKQHIVSERNPMLVQAAKKKFKQEHSGKLFCEICGFDFFSTYGDIGEDYIEVHHKKPVSKMKEGEKTKIQDVAVVCSNCHKIIHRKKPWLTIEQVKKIVEKRRKKG
ncbi:MAG: HNH endonuclease [Clostridia bacterium]|nr:HNH endonuclease [Clostridia bacterium]